MDQEERVCIVCMGQYMKFWLIAYTKASSNRLFCTDLLEPSPHANVRRTNISCADLFIVQHKCDYLNIIVDHWLNFLFSIKIWRVKISNIIWAHISRLASLFTIHIKSEFGNVFFSYWGWKLLDKSSQVKIIYFSGTQCKQQENQHDLYITYT